MSTDIHALSGAYALDALDDQERADFERHLADCAGCRAEVAGFWETAAALAALAETTPPARLRDRVLADAAVVRPLPPATDRARRRRRWSALVAAAATVAAAAGGIVWQSSDRPDEPTAVERVVEAPDAERASQTLPGGGSLTVYRSLRLGKAAVEVEGLPALESGQVYQMWLQDAAGSMVPAGTVPPGVSSAAMVLEGEVESAVGAGVTIEPVGGSTEPTSEPVAVVTFDPA